MRISFFRSGYLGGGSYIADGYGRLWTITSGPTATRLQRLGFGTVRVAPQDDDRKLYGFSEL